jgi:hypothetical protein
VLTATGTSSSVAQAQSNLTFDGTTLSVTSNVRTAAGTAAIPTHSFTADPSTGLHWGGTSQLYFDTSGLTRMVISNSNVGIGTTTTQNWGQQTVTFDVSGGAIRSTAASAASAAVTVTGGTNESGYGTVSGSFANLYDGNLATFWNINAIGGATYLMNFTWASSTITKVRITFLDNTGHEATQIQIYSNSGRTTKIFDSGTLSPASYFVYGGSYVAYDCALATPITCTQLWFTFVGSTYQMIPNEIQPYVGSTAGPEFIAYDSAGASSNKVWSEYYATSNAYWRLADDAGVTVSNWLNVTRSNLTTSSIRFLLGTTSNIERMTLLSNGNIGIGTSNPQWLVDISGGRTQMVASGTAPLSLGGTTAVNIMNFTTTSGTRRWAFQIGNTETGSGNVGSDFLLNRSDDAGTQNGTPAMTVQRSTGYVGVGASAPSNYLHIQKGSYSTPANGADGTTFGINFGSTNYTDQAKILTVDRTNTGGVWGGELALYTSYNAAASTEKMRIDATGHVGIGIAAPRFGLSNNAQNNAILSLDVSGQIYGRLPVYINTGTTLDISTAASNAAYRNTYIYLTNSGFSNLNFPTTALTSAFGGTFFQLKNSTTSYMNVSVTGTIGITSPVTIAPSNAITFVVSPSNAGNAMLLF